MELDILKPRHSLAHILAQAVQQAIDPRVTLGTGPAVEDGFYYDMLFSQGVEFGAEQLAHLTKTMQGIVKHNQAFRLFTAADKDEALHVVALIAGESHGTEHDTTRFKQELILKFAAAGVETGTTPTYTFWLNTIPNAAADKLLAAAQPGYRELYATLSSYLADKDPQFVDQCITFCDLCE